MLYEKRVDRGREYFVKTIDTTILFYSDTHNITTYCTLLQYDNLYIDKIYKAY